MTSIERFIQEQDRIIAKDKEETLLSLGIVDREYAPEGKIGWPYEKYDYIDGQKRYYKEVAAKVTDEEYAVILEKAEMVSKIKKKKEKFQKITDERVSPEDITSKVATILRGIAGVSIVVAVVVAIILFGEENTVSLGGAILGAAFVEGVLFWALAEILDRLTEIAYYSRKTMNNTKG